MSNSKKFEEDMGIFLRCSPIIPPPPAKCERCVEVHIIAKDLAYCKLCHHPVEVDADVEDDSQIRVIKTTIARQLWQKVVGF